MKRDERTKTIYVLGAGFGVDAGFPVQSQILGRIYNLSDRLRDASSGITDLPLHVVDEFQASVRLLIPFINDVFAGVPTLEDVFTFLDQIINQRGSCPGYDLDNLQKLRTALNKTILFIFHEAGQHIDQPAHEFYRNISSFFIEKRIRSGQQTDPYCLVVLNWDSLIEDEIFWCLRKTKILGSVDIDYCCYTTPLGGSSPHIPSLIQKASGLYNIKVLKLHGSTNWLICPSCSRLFTGVGGKEDIWSQYVTAKPCLGCTDLFEPQHHGKIPLLTPFFVSPTFMKVFDNAHIQMTWHNAQIDLAEATEIVFIGYSLPLADYHFRNLLRKSITKNCRIKVVLRREDFPRPDTPPNLHQYFAETRYNEFFGPNRVRFIRNGVAGYFKPLLRRTSLNNRLRSISRLIGRTGKRPNREIGR